MTRKQRIDRAWNNNTNPIPGKNPNLHRTDRLGNEIYKPVYGKGGDKGWEIDHSNPRSKGGTDSPRNLQAMQTPPTGRRGTSTPTKACNHSVVRPRQLVCGTTD